MDGTRYVDGVLVDTTQLSRTEASKAFHILQDRLDNWETGINSGCEITVNPVNTSRVDLAAGDGYSLDGEYVEVTADQLNIQMADNSLGAVNWICVFYTETKTSPNPHETNGNIYPTENARGFRVVVLTPAQFSALPLTDPTFASDAQDRLMLAGIVTATGGALTAANIDQPLSWRSLKYAIQATPGLSGVTIYKVSDETPEGNDGILKFDVAPNRLSWQAPGEAGFGASVNVPSDGVYTLTALGGSTIQVSVTVAALPVSNTQVTVTIQGLYTQDVPRMSSTDRHHRSMQGTGIPSSTNPHGLSIDDITPGFQTDITIHQQQMHQNGIWRGSSPTCLLVSINEAPIPDQVLITAPVGDDCYWVHGKRLTAIQNTVLLFDDPALPSRPSLFDILVDNVGNVTYSQRVEHTGSNIAPLSFESSIVFVNDEVVAGAHTLYWTSDGAGGGWLTWDAGTPVRVLPGTQHQLYMLRNGKEEVWYYLSDIAAMTAPAGTYSDTINVFAAADASEYMQIAQVFWNGVANGGLGYTWARGGIPGLPLDLRQFGTLGAFNIRDDALREMHELPIDEHNANGVAIGRYDVQGSFGSLWVEQPGAGLNCTVWGQAPVYVKGRRHVVGSYSSPIIVAVPDFDTTVIYVDIDGNVKTVPLTLAGFLLLNAPDAFDSTKYYEVGANVYSSNPWVYTGTPLAIVTASGGNVVGLVDMRRNLSGGNVNIRPWTVGSTVALPSSTYQAVEFYSLDTAFVYALIQGQEQLECVYAVLSSPVTHRIPTLKNMTLTGTMILDNNWSGIATVFDLGDAANVTFENLKIYQGGSFVGAATLSLVETIATAVNSSTVTFDNVEVNWVGCGHLVQFIATGPLSCKLVVDDLVATCGGGAPSLFQVDVAADPLTISGLIISGTPTAVIQTNQGISVLANNCNHVTTGADFVTLVAPGSLSGSFSDLRGFGAPFSGSGSVSGCEWSACNFASATSFENVGSCKFSSVAFAAGATFGSAVAKAANLEFAGCSIGGDWALYADNVQVSACRCSQVLRFGGNGISVSASKIVSTVQHANWASSDIRFAACELGSFQHAPSAIDLIDWSFVGCSFTGSISVQWNAEEMHSFNISECRVTGPITCVGVGSPAKRIRGVIQGCHFDTVGTAIQLAFCRDVHVVDNHIRCVARIDNPPILLGQGLAINSQDYHDIDISRNSFEIVDAVMGIPPDVGVPVIYVSHDQPSGVECTGISICRNKFQWDNVDVAHLVTCVVYEGRFAYGFRLDENELLFTGDNSDVPWNTSDSPGVRNAHRMALCLGYGSYNAVNHSINLGTATFRGNTLFVSGAFTASKWIVYDFQAPTSGTFSSIGNTSLIGTARLTPPPPGTPNPALDFLNDIVDNAT